MRGDDDQIAPYKGSRLRVVKFFKHGSFKLALDSYTACSPLILTWNTLLL
jgi:hypothetical protein